GPRRSRNRRRAAEGRRRGGDQRREVDLGWREGRRGPSVRSELMTRAEKAKRIGAILDDLYPAPPIPLEHRDPFTLLVAVVLSAQTTDAQVNRVTPALFARAATPAALAALSETEILALIRSCGLAPAKAKNLRALAKQ